jgi:glucose/arabinose dehydrogenase
MAVAARPARVVFCLSLAVSLLVPVLARAQLQLVPYVSGLQVPVGFVQDPSNPSIQYVIEQVGRIRTIVNGSLLSTPFLDVSSLISCCGEQGLLGLAFPSDYATSRRFYINYTNAAGNTVVARYLRSVSNPLVADPASRFPLRWGGVSTEIFQPFANHNGGHIAFDPDGYLYIGMGDGGSGNDPQNNAQNQASLLGKMLRVDVNVSLSNANGYVVPPSNPWSGNTIGVLPEIWAGGLRNPWKFSFDPPALGGVGALIIGDVGQNNWEEVDYEGPGCSGRNYGWRDFEGNHVNPNPLNPAPVQPLPGSAIAPMLEYPHPVGSSVIGGVVYRGPALRPSYWGRYFYGDLNGRVWSVTPVPSGCGATTDGPSLEHTDQFGGPLTGGLLTAIGTDAVGEMYFVNYSTGTVLKMVDPIAARIRPPATDFYGLHDRRADLVWFNEATRRMASWHMGGTLGNQAVMGGEMLSTPALPAGWRVVGAFSERLGETELFLQSDSGQLGMWVFNGRTFRNGVNLNPGMVSDPNWKVRAVGDFNHDGHGDLLWQYAPTGLIAFWFMNGSNLISTFALPFPAPTGPDWEIFGTGDSDLDGNLDLYWQHRTTGALALWRLLNLPNLSGQIFFASGLPLSASPSDPGWRAVGLADLDLDGSPDIVFQHVPSGFVATWYLNGITVRSGTYLNPSNVGDSNWKLVGPR